MRTRADVLITVDDLMRQMHTGQAPALLDVRWQLSVPDGEPAYLEGHIPGAVYVSLEDELSDRAVAGRGRHPLPSGLALEAAARRWGLRNDRSVVVYDDWNRAGSARAWWVLTAAGLADVRILDGGWSAWKSAGGSVEIGAIGLEPGDLTLEFKDLYAGGLPTLTAHEASAVPVLVDARAPERFSGAVEPVDPVAGHIPGARNVPSTSLLSGDGTFLDDSELAALFAQWGLERGGSGEIRVGVYCGSGVTAAVAIAGLASTGIDSALFPGSWSQWSSDPALPVATGTD